MVTTLHNSMAIVREGFETESVHGKSSTFDTHHHDSLSGSSVREIKPGLEVSGQPREPQVDDAGLRSAISVMAAGVARSETMVGQIRKTESTPSRTGLTARSPRAGRGRAGRTGGR
jgi:hypothetical protein